MKRIYLLLISIVFSFNLYSQITINQDGKKQALPNMVLQVKQLNEFVNRFNYVHDFYGKEITSQFQKQFPRDKYISLLFNNQDKRLLQNSAEYFGLIEHFIKDVTKGNGQYIAKYSMQIYAVTECSLTYKGKPIKATLILNREVTKTYAKWVIRKVKAKFLDIPQNEQTINSLPPNSHETDFISLKKALDKKANFTSLLPKGIKYNQLSAFLYLISKGELKFQYVEKLKYLILDIPDWVIAIQEYKRDSDNSGWLISNISKKDKKLKLYLGLAQ